LAGRYAVAAEQRDAVRIEADRMETDQKARTVYFSGNVIARQGDLRIQADDMQVFYKMKDEGDAAEDQAIDRLVARGHVTVAKKDWTASGNALEYFSGRRLAILTGDARAWQGGNMVSGQRIELYLDEGRTVVEKDKGSSERVKAFFYPEEKSRRQTEEDGKPEPAEAPRHE